MSWHEGWLATCAAWLRQVVSRFHRAPRCAVLIDGDATPQRHVDALFAHASARGTVTTARVYGNFTRTKADGWAPLIRKHGMLALQTYNLTQGKNAADIALVVDAMDLLHSSTVDAFCIVSSDADMAPLMRRIRESGLPAYGYGATQSAISFQQGCTEFTVLEDLSGCKRPARVVRQKSEKRKRPPVDAESLVLPIIMHLGGAHRGVKLSTLGENLSRSHPGFDPRTYRSRSLSDLLSKLDLVEVDLTAAPPVVRLLERGALVLSPVARQLHGVPLPVRGDGREKE